MNKEKICYNIIGSKPLCNIASLNIYNIIYDLYDKILVGINNDKPRYYKIYNTGKGNYFMYKGTRQYLNEFIRL